MDANHLPEVKEALRDNGGLRDAGFRQDQNGQFVAYGCRVTIYPSCGRYEVDIELPGGGAVALDTEFLTAKPSRRSRPNAE
jgi:hypothetical protein